MARLWKEYVLGKRETLTPDHTKPTPRGLRDGIIRRDGGRCQFPVQREADGPITICGRKDRLHVHHVNPRGNGGANMPANLITLCEAHHIDVIHPDMARARRDYRRGDKNAYRKTVKQHKEKAARGEIYWNDEWDHELSYRADRNTHDVKAIQRSRKKKR